MVRQGTTLRCIHNRWGDAPGSVSSVRTGASGAALDCDVTPSDHSFESTTIVRGHWEIVRQKMRAAKIQFRIRGAVQ
jgi:hypothetical protein